MLVFLIFLSTLMIGISLADVKPVKVADYLISKCNVDPNINAPGEFNGESTKMNMYITPMRFLGICDVSETFTIVANVVLNWYDECTSNEFKSEDFLYRNYSLLYFETDTFWAPKLIHLNSQIFKSTKSDDFERGMRLFRSNQGKAYYFYYIYGVFESYCDLDLTAFPFDRYVILSLSLLVIFTKIID